MAGSQISVAALQDEFVLMKVSAASAGPRRGPGPRTRPRPITVPWVANAHGVSSGQTPCASPHSPPEVMALNKSLNISGATSPDPAFSPNAFNNRWRGTDGPNPAELLRPLTTRDLAASEYWAGMAGQQKPFKTASRISLFADLPQGHTILFLSVNS